MGEQGNSKMKEYMHALQGNKVYPKDPYQHGSYMMDPVKVGDQYSDVVDTQILLCNIGNDVLMSMNQFEAGLYVSLRNMAEREKELEVVNNVLYNWWRAELQITRTKDGKERSYQAGIGNYRPPEFSAGYGGDLPQFQQPEEETGNFIQKMLKRRK